MFPDLSRGFRGFKYLEGTYLEDYLRIGVITSPHGVKGEVKVYPTTDDIRRFDDLTDCFLDIKGQMTPVKVTGCKYIKNMTILKFEEYADRNAVEALRNIDIYVDREHAVELEEDEFFLSDVIGFEVISEDKCIGTISDYTENAAGQVIFIVKKPDGSEMMILDIPEFVTGIDMDEEKMFVNVIKGM